MAANLNVGLSGRQAMLRTIIVVVVGATIFLSRAYAAEKEEIAKCAAKKGSAERLICYDNVAKTLGVDKPQTIVVAGKGKWITRTDKSPINDTTNVYLSLSSEQSVDPLETFV